MQTSPAISVDTAALLMEISKRTLWRHLADGRYRQLPRDAQGRTTLLLSEVAPRFTFELPGADDPGASDYALLVRAEQGDPGCQADFAIFLLEQDKPHLAVHWFVLAAEQSHADAMYYLSTLYQQGQGVSQCDETALVWRSKAAAAGHAIARAQLEHMKAGEL